MKTKNKNLQKLFRFLIGTIITLLLLLVSAIVVILAQGKKITDEGKVIETSIIRLSVFPKDVKAYINDKEVTLNENRIENLEPNTYKIKLTKPGYSAWEKSITIEAGIVKDVYAQLYPESIKFDIVTKLNVDKLFNSIDSEYIFYTVTSSTILSENGIWKLKLVRNLLDFNENRPIQVAKFDAPTLVLLKNGYDLKISEDNNKILLLIAKELAYVYDANQSNVKVDLFEKLGFTPTKVEWLRNSDSFIVTKDNLLFEYDINSNQSTLINYNSEENFVYGYGSNTVYYIKAGKIYKYSNRVSALLVLPQKAINLLANISSIRIANFNSNIIVFNSDSGLVFVDLDKNYVELIDTKGLIITMALNGKGIIFENDKKLFSYNLEETTDGSTYKSGVFNLSITTEDLSDIYFSPGTKNVIALKKGDNLTKELILMDFDGTNKRKLVSDFNIKGTTTMISKNSTELYALIHEISVDKLEADNVYKFSLEAKN